MKSNYRNSHCNSLFNTIVFALLLISVGVIFLGFNLGYISTEYKKVIFSWPMLLLIFSLISFCKRHYFSGAVLLLVGGFFIMPRLSTVCPSLFPMGSGEYLHLYWPVLLILFGVLFVLYRLFPPSYKKNKHSWDSMKQAKGEVHTEESMGHSEFTDKMHSKFGSGFVNKESIFSSSEHIVLDPIFTGGEVNTVLGETILDLRKTDIKEGDTYLNTSTVLGSFVIFVPVDWLVDIRAEHIMYSFEDKRYSSNVTNRNKRLVIISSGVLGSGELRN